jgi:hypothetical protein
MFEDHVTSIGPLITAAGTLIIAGHGRLRLVAASNAAIGV